MAEDHPIGAVRGSINYATGGLVHVGGKPIRHAKGSGDGDIITNTAKGSREALEKLQAHTMIIDNARPVLDRLDIDKEGFFMANLDSKMEETLDVLLDPKEQTIRSVFWPEVVELAFKTIRTEGRAPKYVFPIGTQKFTEDKSRGFLGSYSRQAHADFSDIVFDRAFKMLVKRGVPEGEARAMDIMFVNVWKPFGDTVYDNPLAILDWTSVDCDADVHELKRGSTYFEKGVVLSATLSHNPTHRWMYAPRMKTSECWVFKQADSRDTRGDISKHAFHTSFPHHESCRPKRARRSITVRLICAFPPAPPVSHL